MNSKISAQLRQPYPFQFHNVRNISSPEDLANNRKVYVGQAPLTSIISLPTDENVRDYLLEAEGKKRKVPTQVHRAIKDTLINNPEEFSVLNSGVVIVARNCEIDENKKTMFLQKPSIINGSQTQGVIRDFYEENKSLFVSGEFTYHIKFEIIVTDNSDLIADISIARNFQNDVMTISIAGRLGQLEELEQSIQAKIPNSKLQKSETKLSDDYVKTEKLLQVITALIPEELWFPRQEFNKVYTYSMKAKCLKQFQEVFIKAKNPKDPEYYFFKELYQFFMDIAPQAIELYNKWKSHPGFSGTRLRSIERDDNSEIVEVPDGIVFPILSSLSAFAIKTSQGWKIDPPSIFNESELIKTAATIYKEIAAHNPNTMGKNKACYSMLYENTSLYKKFSTIYGK